MRNVNVSSESPQIPVTTMGQRMRQIPLVTRSLSIFCYVVRVLKVPSNKEHFGNQDSKMTKSGLPVKNSNHFVIDFITEKHN